MHTALHTSSNMYMCISQVHYTEGITLCTRVLSLFEYSPFHSRQWHIHKYYMSGYLYTIYIFNQESVLHVAQQFDPCILSESWYCYMSGQFQCSAVCGIMQDIDARQKGDPGDDVVLEALTYYGTTLSVIGLFLTIFTLWGSR